MRLSKIETRLLLLFSTMGILNSLSAVDIFRVQIPSSDDWFARACGLCFGHMSIVPIESSFHLPRAFGQAR